MIELIEVADVDFDWMFGQAQSTRGLTLPPGGVDTPQTLAVVRRMDVALIEAHGQGAWMIVSDRELVGLCGYLRPPTAGEAEIGYGVAASRRNRGHATAAVATMLVAAAADPAISTVVARTGAKNVPSQRALMHNGFVRAGAERDEEGGEMIVWRRAVP